MIIKDAKGKPKNITADNQQNFITHLYCPTCGSILNIKITHLSNPNISEAIFRRGYIYCKICDIGYLVSTKEDFPLFYDIGYVIIYEKEISDYFKDNKNRLFLIIPPPFFYDYIRKIK